MLSETHSFFSWGHPRIPIAKGVDSQPLHPSVYNANYLKGQGGQKTPYAVGGPTKLPPSNSRLWDSNIFAKISAMVGLEPQDKLQAQMEKSTQSYLQPNAKTAKYTPIPVPYSVPVVMKQFLASEASDAVVEKSEIDWLEIAGAQLSSVDEGSDEHRFWNDIVKQLTKIKVLQSTRSLSEAENSTLYSIINQIKGRLPEISRVAPVAPDVPYGIHPPPEPEAAPAGDMSQQAAIIGDIVVNKQHIRKAEAEARESRQIADEEYARVLKTKDRYDNNPSKGNLSRHTKQVKYFRKVEAVADALEADLDERKYEHDEKLEDMPNIEHRGRRGIPPPLPPAGAVSPPMSPPPRPPRYPPPPSYPPPAVSRPSYPPPPASPTSRFAPPFVPSLSNILSNRYAPLFGSSTESSPASRFASPLIPSPSGFAPPHVSSPAPSSVRSFDSDNIPSGEELGFAPRREDLTINTTPRTILKVVRSLNFTTMSPDSFLSSLNSSSTRPYDSSDPSPASTASRLGRSMFFGDLTDNISPIGTEPVIIHSPEQKPVITTLAPPSAQPEEKHQEPASSVARDSNPIVEWKPADYQHSANSQEIDYVGIATNFKKMTVPLWYKLAEGLGITTDPRQGKAGLIRAVLQNPIIRQYVASKSGLKNILDKDRMKQIGILASKGQIDNNLIPWSSRINF